MYNEFLNQRFAIHSFTDSPLRHLLYLNEMVNFLHHTEDLWCCFYFYSSQHLTQTESEERTLLALRAVNTALYLGNLDLSHVLL